MGDPLKEQDEALAALRQVVEAAGPWLEGLPERLVYDRGAEALLGELGGPLPEEGAGTGAAVERGCCGWGRRPRPPRRGHASTTS